MDLGALYNKIGDPQKAAAAIKKAYKLGKY
jgi:hypothetical protein